MSLDELAPGQQCWLFDWLSDQTDVALVTVMMRVDSHTDGELILLDNGKIVRSMMLHSNLNEALEAMKDHLKGKQVYKQKLQEQIGDLNNSIAARSAELLLVEVQQPV